MSRQFIGAILLVLFLLGALASASLAYSYVRARGDQLRLQAQVNMVNRQRALANSLLNEAIAYSKTHPELAAALESMRGSDAQRQNRQEIQSGQE